MLKHELVNELTDNLNGYLKKDINLVVDVILNSMTEALHEGRRVEIRGFGSFSVRKRKPRETKNPKTGKMMHIPPRKTLHFTMSQSLKNTLVKK